MKFYSAVNKGKSRNELHLIIQIIPIHNNNFSEQAAAVMVELLGTYTADNASAAREDAQRCILSALADPNTFLLDPLLALKPVRFLEGELIHDLLLVFVQDKLPAYLHFYQHHKEFLEHTLGKDIDYQCR